MSTYSPSLRIELITTGDQAGTWGTTTNTNMGTLIESAIAGYTSVSITSADQALTALNGAADESRNMTIALTTTTTANFNVYAPPAEKTYVIQNTTIYTATIYNSTVLGNTTAAGLGVTIPAGKTMTIWSDGTNFRVQNTHIIGTVVGDVTGNVTGNVSGNAGTATTASGLSSGVTIVTPTLTGAKETRVAIPASNIDLNAGNYFTRTISGTTTFTVSNVPASNTVASFVLELTNGGAFTVNWWATIKWPGGIAPQLTASGRDVLGFYTFDNGTTWNGFLLGKDVK